MAESEPSLLNRGLFTGFMKGLAVGLLVGGAVAAGVVLVASGFSLAAIPAAGAAIWGAVTGSGWAAISGATIAGLSAKALGGAVIAGGAVAGLTAISKTLGEAASVRNEQATAQHRLRQMHERSADQDASRNPESEVSAGQAATVAGHDSPEALEQESGPGQVEMLERREAARRDAAERSGGRYA